MQFDRGRAALAGDVGKTCHTGTLCAKAVPFDIKATSGIVAFLPRHRLKTANLPVVGASTVFGRRYLSSSVLILSADQTSKPIDIRSMSANNRKPSFSNEIVERQLYNRPFVPFDRHHGGPGSISLRLSKHFEVVPVPFFSDYTLLSKRTCSGRENRHTHTDVKTRHTHTTRTHTQIVPRPPLFEKSRQGNPRFGLVCSVIRTTWGMCVFWRSKRADQSMYFDISR